MAGKKFYDPYIEALDRFNRDGVGYVVIGMSGINYYALKASETFSTQDFDIFIKPTISNVKKVISIFERLNYSLVSSERSVKEADVRNIVKNKNTILATDPYGIVFKLLLVVSGYTFDQMRRDAVVFNIKNVPIKVAKLSKLLMSKKIAGREKDRLFLKRYEILLKDKEKKNK